MTLDLLAVRQASLIGSAAFATPWIYWSIWAAGQPRRVERRRKAIARVTLAAAVGLFAVFRLLPNSL